MPYQCFLLSNSGQVLLFLRRFTFSTRGFCSHYEGSGHNAMVEVGLREAIPSGHGGAYMAPQPWDEDDPRWPSHCSCGYAFTADDPQDVFQMEVLVDGEGRQFVVNLGRIEASLPSTPTGAMWDSPWMGEKWSGEDGKSWTVKLPDGTPWHVDGPSKSSGVEKGWSRTGEAPNLTVTPSILSHGYHGWLSGGVLSDDLEGRTYG